MAPTGPFFAPLPARAIGDKRLTATYFRLLAAIAQHDRLSGHSGEGQICWAGTTRLARECGLNLNNVSTAIQELVKFGYIEARPHPLDGRSRAFAVIYNKADLAFVMGEYSSPTGEALESNHSPTDHHLVRPTGKNDQSEHRHTIDKREERKKIRPKPEKYSAEAAALSRGAVSLDGDRNNVGGQLAIIERALHKIKESPTKQDVLQLRRLCERLENVSIEYEGETGDPIGGRALRLHEEVRGILEGLDEKHV